MMSLLQLILAVMLGVLPTDSGGSVSGFVPNTDSGGSVSGMPINGVGGQQTGP
jgi:hypothetical protein